MLWSSAYAQEAVPQSPPMGGFIQFMPIVALVAIMYFLMIRPNQRKEKERRDMLASITKGDRVITSGGMCGVVVGLTEKSVVLRVSDEPLVKIEFVRGAVSKVLRDDDKEKKKD